MTRRLSEAPASPAPETPAPAPSLDVPSLGQSVGTPSHTSSGRGFRVRTGYSIRRFTVVFPSDKPRRGAIAPRIAPFPVSTLGAHRSPYNGLPNRRTLEKTRAFRRYRPMGIVPRSRTLEFPEDFTLRRRGPHWVRRRPSTSGWSGRGLLSDPCGRLGRRVGRLPSFATESADVAPPRAFRRSRGALGLEHENASTRRLGLRRFAQ